VTGQLIDASTGMHIWAERYERDPADIFAVQNEITKASLQQSGRPLWMPSGNARCASQ
jgi:adenylate cyclase